MSLTKNITKESAPVRQRHYTTKTHWLVDLINIFQLILKLFHSNRRYIIFADTFHSCIGVGSFNKIPVPAFSCRDNRKIFKYLLSCLLLCKSWLFKIYECNIRNCTAPDSRPVEITACISLYRWYHDLQIWYKIRKCIQTVWSCST